MKSNVNDRTYFLRWLNKHMRSERGVAPSKRIWEMARRNNWLYNDVVYRGMNWGGWEYKPYDSPFGEVRVGRRVLLEPVILSWTKTLRWARMYIISNGTILRLPKETVLKYAKSGHRVGIVLRGIMKGGIDIDKAIDKLDNSGDLPGLFESEVLGIITRVKVVEYIDYRLLK